MTHVPALPPSTRRSILLGGLALGAGATLAGLPRLAQATSAGTVLPLVDPLPGPPDRSAFAPDEQIMGTYLILVAPLANSIVDDDPERYGWMEDGWWRTPVQPFNARIMEHVATLAWFYATERSWNPYRGDQKLLARLDAAIGFYLGLQNDDGSFSEYAWNEHHLSPTGFGTVALSATHHLLSTVGVLPDRVSGIEAAIRKSSAWLLDLGNPHWNTPVQYTNQVVAGLVGVTDAAEVLGDPSIAELVPNRLEFLWNNSHAPAGHTLEPLAYDWGYSFTVALPDIADLAAKTDSPVPLRFARSMADFFQYAVVWEPDGSGGLHYSGLSARNVASSQLPTIADTDDRSALGRLFLDEVPMLAAFHVSDTEKAAARADWAASTAPIPVPSKGNTSPRTWLHVPRSPAGPTEAERADAQASMRPMAEDRFTEVRLSTAILDQHYLFLRRPNYYLGALQGQRVRSYPLQRYGLGLLWHPRGGTFVWSMNDWNRSSWSYRLDGTPNTQASQSALGPMPATYHAGSDGTAPLIDLAAVGGQEGVLTMVAVGTSTSPDPALRSETTTWPGGITQTVTTGGPAWQEIPLVVKNDDQLTFDGDTAYVHGSDVSLTAGSLRIVRGDVTCVLAWDGPRPVKLRPAGQELLAGTRQQYELFVHHDGSIRVEATMIDNLSPDQPFVAFAEAERADRVAVQVLNTDDQVADIRITTALGSRLVSAVSPGRSAYQLITVPAGEPTPDVVNVLHRTARRAKSTRVRLS